MFRTLKQHRAVWLAAGLLVGLVGGGLWPDAPIHAVATAQQDNFAICTGEVDIDSEAVFFLDFLTGDLKAAVLSPRNGKFLTFYQHNILGDLEVDLSKNPRFLMVTGRATFQRGAGGTQLASSAVYIAEVTTGKIVAYGIPWNQARKTALQRLDAQFIPLDISQFRIVAVRE